MKLLIDVQTLSKDIVDQLIYSTYFVSEKITNIEKVDGSLSVHHESDADIDKIKSQINSLIQRFSEHEYGFKEKIYFENRVNTPYEENILNELLELKIMKKLDEGVFIFREPFTTLVEFIDGFIVKKFGGYFEAKHENYPVVINGTTLDKTNHFTSFPEHVHFVSHLKEDLDVIEEFTKEIRKNEGWKDDHNIHYHNLASEPKYMINPATCYHCYEGLQGETLQEDGVIVTAVSKCHRYESRNHMQFGRLLDFTMREIIFVGKPDFVKENRMKSIELLKEQVKEWELDCHLENANDPFFTDDYQVKASFQRQQEMKFELRMNIPFLQSTMSVTSSNFHSNTFGKAFNIQAGKRPAVTGCLAFGLERFVLAFLAQYGLNEANWPTQFLKDLNDWKGSNGR